MIIEQYFVLFVVVAGVIGFIIGILINKKTNEPLKQGLNKKAIRGARIELRKIAPDLNEKLTEVFDSYDKLLENLEKK